MRTSHLMDFKFYLVTQRCKTHNHYIILFSRCTGRSYINYSYHTSQNTYSQFNCTICTYRIIVPRTNNENCKCAVRELEKIAKKHIISTVHVSDLVNPLLVHTDKTKNAAAQRNALRRFGLFRPELVGSIGNRLPTAEGRDPASFRQISILLHGSTYCRYGSILSAELLSNRNP